MSIKIDQLIRSQRKSIALILKRDGLLIVRAPLHASLKSIQKVVDQKEAWILKARVRLQATPQPEAPKPYRAGDCLPLLGRLISLKVIPAPKPQIIWEGENLFITEPGLPHAAELLEYWYRARAKEHFQHRVAELAGEFHLRPTGVTITGARTRWGSCSAKNRLSFTWRLVMAPPAVVDYVIIHELAHIEVKNHSAKFWAKVQSMLPGWEKQRLWLKEHGRELEL